jgi:hypothetical protein
MGVREANTMTRLQLHFRGVLAAFFPRWKAASRWRGTRPTRSTAHGFVRFARSKRKPARRRWRFAPANGEWTGEGGGRNRGRGPHGLDRICPGLRAVASWSDSSLGTGAGHLAQLRCLACSPVQAGKVGRLEAVSQSLLFALWSLAQAGCRSDGNKAPGSLGGPAA